MPLTTVISYILTWFLFINTITINDDNIHMNKEAIATNTITTAIITFNKKSIVTIIWIFIQVVSSVGYQVTANLPNTPTFTYEFLLIL